MYDVGGKQLNGIKSMHINSLDCVRVIKGESECFCIDSGVRHGCILSPSIHGCINEGCQKGDVEEESEISVGAESRDCLISCMQMTLFCVASWKKTYREYWNALLSA